MPWKLPGACDSCFASGNVVPVGDRRCAISIGGRPLAVNYRSPVWKTPMTDTVLLKKYANRRLYDTDRSRYVTLEEVAEIIKSGRRVKVVDAKSREDVTAFILTQIVLEMARANNILLPAPLLHLAIQYGDNVLAEFFEKYLEQTLKTYLVYRSAFDEQVAKLFDLPASWTQMASRGMPGMSPFQSLFEDVFGAADKDDKDS